MNRDRRGSSARTGAYALGLASLIVTFVLATLAGAAGPASSGSVLATARTAVAKQSGVHVVFTARSSLTSKSEHIVADVGKSVGAETVVQGKSRLTVELTTTDAYVRGNASGFTTLFGLTTTQAKRIGTKWAHWKAGTSMYSTLKSDVTIAAVAALLPNPNGTKLATRVVNGATQDVVTWSTPASSNAPIISNTLIFSTGSAVLPIEETSTTKGNTSVTTLLSHWGEQVSVTAPQSGATIAG